MEEVAAAAAAAAAEEEAAEKNCDGVRVKEEGLAAAMVSGQGEGLICYAAFGGRSQDAALQEDKQILYILKKWTKVNVRRTQLMNKRWSSTLINYQIMGCT